MRKCKERLTRWAGDNALLDLLERPPSRVDFLDPPGGSGEAEF